MTKAEYINNDALLQQLPVFYQPWYLDLYGIEWQLMYEESPDVSWVFPYFKERKLIFTLCRPQAFMPYYGPFPVLKTGASRPPGIAALPGLKQFVKQHTELVLSPFPDFDWSVLKELGFSAKPRVTYRLDLAATEAALFSKVEKKHSRNIIRAQEELNIKEGIPELELLTSWMNHAYEKRGAKQRITAEFVAKYIHTVLANNGGIALTAFDRNGSPRSMVLVLLDPGGEQAYYIIAANSFAEPHNAANTGLIWQSILIAKERGYKHFDFEGSSIPGIARFFAKFGAVPTHFAHWQHSSGIWKMKQKLFG